MVYLLFLGDLVITKPGDKEDGARKGWRRGMVMVQTTTGSWCSKDEGMFPLHICWIPATDYYSISQAEETKMGRAVEKFAQVKQSLTAQLEDELNLQVGQIVKITHIIDKDWYR